MPGPPVADLNIDFNIKPKDITIAKEQPNEYLRAEA